MNDADEALIKYACEVDKLIKLHHRVHERLDRCALQEFHVQLMLVTAMTQVAKLPVIRVEQYKEGEK